MLVTVLLKVIDLIQSVYYDIQSVLHSLTCSVNKINHYCKSDSEVATSIALL